MIDYYDFMCGVGVCAMFIGVGKDQDSTFWVGVVIVITTLLASLS